MRFEEKDCIGLLAVVPFSVVLIKLVLVRLTHDVYLFIYFIRHEEGRASKRNKSNKETVPFKEISRIRPY